MAKRALPSVDERAAVLRRRRNLKMARSAHGYVRGNTVQFYEWLAGLESQRLPHGPAIWICGDCHVGNLGPVADAEGRVRIQIRDFDQTVIGNPAHDLIRLALSLASAARGSDLPGVTTAHILEAIMEGYELAFEDGDENGDDDGHEAGDDIAIPESVQIVLKQAAKRTWKHLARERLENTRLTIPLGKRFWPISEDEAAAISELFEREPMRRLATMLRTRDDTSAIDVLDAAYWMKGCSSLGFLRYAVVLDVDDSSGDADRLCLMDVKEAVVAAAPSYPDGEMPSHDGERVVAGAQHLSPFLGERMASATLLDRSVFVRELLPQDLKIEMARLTQSEAMRAAHYLAAVLGVAHARQMDRETRRSWRGELQNYRSRSLDAPSWLWSSVVELLVNHEGAYLEHCRLYALEAADG